MNIEHRLPTPRIQPLELPEWDAKLRERQMANRPKEMGEGDAPVFNIFKTLANHPRMAEKFTAWGGQMLFRSTLSPRDRELAILRTGWLCRATYEWHHHVEIGLDHAGLSEADIAACKAGPEAPGISPDDAALLAAVDELHTDQSVSGATWESLAARLSTEQLIDLVMVVGNYTMVSMALNSFGVQLEDKYRD